MESSLCRGRVSRSAFGVALIDSEPHKDPPPSELLGLMAPPLDAPALACAGMPDGRLVGIEAFEDFDAYDALDAECDGCVSWSRTPFTSSSLSEAYSSSLSLSDMNASRLSWESR